MMFWKEPARFNVNQATRILKVLREMEFWIYDIEFYEKEFLPVVMKKVASSEDNQALFELAEELERYKGNRVNEQMLSDYVKRINDRLLFVETKLHLVKKMEFIEIIKSDLTKYRLTLHERNRKKRQERIEIRKALDLKTKQINQFVKSEHSKRLIKLRRPKSNPELEVQEAQSQTQSSNVNDDTSQL